MIQSNALRHQSYTQKSKISGVLKISDFHETGWKIPDIFKYKIFSYFRVGIFIYENSILSYMNEKETTKRLSLDDIANALKDDNKVKEIIARILEDTVFNFGTSGIDDALYYKFGSWVSGYKDKKDEPVIKRLEDITDMVEDSRAFEKIREYEIIITRLYNHFKETNEESKEKEYVTVARIIRGVRGGKTKLVNLAYNALDNIEIDQFLKIKDYIESFPEHRLASNENEQIAEFKNNSDQLGIATKAYRKCIQNKDYETAKKIAKFAGDSEGALDLLSGAYNLILSELINKGYIEGIKALVAEPEHKNLHNFPDNIVLGELSNFYGKLLNLNKYEDAYSLVNALGTIALPHEKEMTQNRIAELIQDEDYVPLVMLVKTFGIKKFDKPNIIEGLSAKIEGLLRKNKYELADELFGALPLKERKATIINKVIVAESKAIAETEDDVKKAEHANKVLGMCRWYKKEVSDGTRNSLENTVKYVSEMEGTASDTRNGLYLKAFEISREIVSLIKNGYNTRVSTRKIYRALAKSYDKIDKIKLQSIIKECKIDEQLFQFKPEFKEAEKADIECTVGYLLKKIGKARDYYRKDSKEYLMLNTAYLELEKFWDAHREYKNWLYYLEAVFHWLERITDRMLGRYSTKEYKE